MGSSATIFLSIASMLYMIMVAIVYFTKEKVNTSENKIFSKLVLISLASLFSEIYITFIPIDMKIPLFVISLKVYLILCVFWLSYFMEYVFIITRNNENKLLINYKQKYKKTYIRFWIITAFVISAVILLPISFYNENGMKYSYGSSVDVVFGLSALYMVIMFIYIIKNLKWIILFICLIGFFALAEDVFNNEIMQGDVVGYKFISTYLIRDSLTPIFKIITWFGSATCLIPLAVILFFTIKNKKVGGLVGANLVIVTILSQALKIIIQRPRPTEYRIINETGYSFPSGHSMVSMAFYGFLIYLIYKNIKNKYLKISLIVILSLLIVMIGISRIYLGVHYTSDVCAGFLVSLSYLIIYINFANKLVLSREK